MEQPSGSPMLHGFVGAPLLSAALGAGQASLQADGTSHSTSSEQFG
jgi:hypothetical protein